MFIRLIAVLLAILATPYAATGMTFVWSPNDPIENVTGYKIYYGPSPSPPYDGVGADQGNSPIDAGNITQQEVTFPASYIGQTLYFVATAYSDLSESDYSTVVVVTYDGSTTQTVILSSSAGEGGTVEPYGDNPVSVGTDFTFRFFPDLGYTLSGLLVDSISVNPEPEYTFWDVGQSHDIIPIFQFVEPDPTTTDPPPDDTTTDPTITYTGLIWQLDYNGNGIWDDPVIDRLYSSTFGSPGDSIITGDWNNDGKTEIGTVTVDALGTGLIWQLDYNGNGIWDGTPVDYKYTSTFGSPNDLVITGDWNNDGRTKIGTGTVNSSGGLTWYLDYNGNGIWDGTAIDRMYVSTFGSPGD
ncbi:MAG: hypothetical protein Q8L10_05385, partial [Candidatus Moranbacteria bacterium]|nr:hypothetical protein [Candidatus Moranbacteria bacterium]